MVSISKTCFLACALLTCLPVFCSSNTDVAALKARAQASKKEVLEAKKCYNCKGTLKCSKSTIGMPADVAKLIVEEGVITELGVFHEMECKISVLFESPVVISNAHAEGMITTTAPYISFDTSVIENITCKNQDTNNTPIIELHDTTVLGDITFVHPGVVLVSGKTFIKGKVNNGIILE